MKVLHIAMSIDPKYGGTAVSAPSLVKSLRQGGVDASLAVLGSSEDRRHAEEFSIPCYIAKASHLYRLARSNELEHYIFTNDADIIHCHGLWQGPSHYGARIARKRNLPYLVSPRGMMDPYCLNARSKYVKKLAMLLYQRNDLLSATALHATSQMEAHSIRLFGLNKPVAVIPNGIAIEHLHTDRNHSRSRTGDTRTVLFLSRISPIKGLLNLVKAWSLLQCKFKDWKLVIAGPDYRGHVRQLKESIKDHGVSKSVILRGACYGQEKNALYKEADLFVLPSFSENFGIVVLEALAFGLPTITTKGTPWKQLEDFNCGWWIDIGLEPLVNALTCAMGISDSERDRLSANAFRLAEKYSWSNIARQMTEVYMWILHNGKIPDCLDVSR